MIIGKKQIGPAHPVYIIAELSANHGGSLERALKTVKAASEAGADAIKIQTYTADSLTLNIKKPPFLIQGGTPWDGKSLYDLYGEAFTPWEWHPKIKKAAEDEGLDFFSTAFDPSAVDFLEKLGVCAHKVASFEIVDTPLIESMARTGKPIIFSTGMATLAEIDEALSTAHMAGSREIVLLKCTSAYPAPLEEMNLKTVVDMMERFDCPIGISDHTLGSTVANAAVAMGACMVEKHFILSRSQKGPDSSFSMEPQEFKSMVEGIRAVTRSLGKISYGVTPSEAKNQRFRRSLFVVKEISRGECFSPSNIRSLRPDAGLPPKYYSRILGQPALADLTPGTPLSWEHVSEELVKGKEAYPTTLLAFPSKKPTKG